MFFYLVPSFWGIHLGEEIYEPMSLSVPICARHVLHVLSIHARYACTCCIRAHIVSLCTQMASHVISCVQVSFLVQMISWVQDSSYCSRVLFSRPSRKVLPLMYRFTLDYILSIQLEHQKITGL